MPELLNSMHVTGEGHRGVEDRGIAALVNQDRLRRILTRMLDENEFLGPYGIRALSRYHAEHPYVVHVNGHEYRVNYLPAESDTGMFGGNSNWRGPVWMPVNGLLIRALLTFYLYYGDNFKIECPTGSGNSMNLFQVAGEIANRLERNIREEFGEDVEVDTHIEPLEPELPFGSDAAPERVATIAEALSRFAKDTAISDIHSVRVRDTAAGEIVNFHCRAVPSMSVIKVHENVDAIERALRRAFPSVKRVISHAEPPHA